MQILQEFDSRCQALSAKDHRGFKQEFEVTSKLSKISKIELGLDFWLVKLEVSVMCANVFGSVKELNDIGKDLPTRAGDSEANRLKNRYPSILPCKCKTYTRTI